MTVTRHPQVDDYLRRLDRAARVLPRHQRDELVAEIRSHVDAGLAPDAGEADVRNLLDDLGSPDEIVAAARPDQLPTRRGAREVFALILLVTGFPPLIGWLAGLGLLLWSPLWSARQKLLGVLVWPGGFAVAFFYVQTITARSGKCSASTSGSGPVVTRCDSSGLPPELATAIAIVFYVAPLVVAAYLYRAAGKRRWPV